MGSQDDREMPMGSDSGYSQTSMEIFYYFNNHAEHFETIRQSKGKAMTGLGQKEKHFRCVVVGEIFLRR